MKINTLLTLELQLAALLVGLRTKLPANGTYSVAGVERTRDELAKTVEGFFTLFKSTREARATVRQLAHERDLKTPELRLLLQEIRSMLNTKFGMESPELLAFGFKPRNRSSKKGAARTSEEKPAA